MEHVAIGTDPVSVLFERYMERDMDRGVVAANLRVYRDATTAIAEVVHPKR